MAASFLGLILVNINPSYRQQQLSYTIQKVNMKVLILSDSFKSSNYIEIINSLIPNISTNNAYNIKSNKFPSLKSIVRINKNSIKIPGFINLTDLFIHGKTSVIKLDVEPNDAANIQFTSGTTGLPKAATLSHINILNNGYMIGNRCQYTQKDNIALPVPFYHCFGMILGTLAAITRGLSISLVSEQFSAQKTLQTIQKYHCTSIYGVPTMFIEYLKIIKQNTRIYQLNTLRTGIIAGSLCPEKLMIDIRQKMYLQNITICYGMTQTSPVTFQTNPNDSLLKKTTTVGTILPGIEAKIVNEQNQICQIGQTGEFMVKGWPVMIGYWGDKQATQDSIQDGWMKSGDLATMDQEGYLTIVGRKKDMIIRGGQNVYPKEIEDYLRNLEEVIDVQIVGILDQYYGEQIAAIIKVKDLNKNELTKQKVYKFCKNSIAHYKIPKYIKFVTQLPMTITGKPQKYKMKQELQIEKKQDQLKQYEISK